MTETAAIGAQSTAAVDTQSTPDTAAWDAAVQTMTEGMLAAGMFVMMPIVNQMIATMNDQGES